MKILKFSDDLLGLKEFANRLERFIKIEQKYVDDGLVVGLSSRFGSGKTTFLQMWMSELQEKIDEDKPIVILLNAWESDYYGDPLFAIISALVECIAEEGSSADKIINAAKDLGWFSTAIGGQIVNKFTGINPVAAGDLAEKKKKGREDKNRMLPDTFTAFEARKKAMGSLKIALQEYIDEKNIDILFLVDELDRCRPDYAISYLETIKHIFDIKGTVFLLAADRRHLENSAKSAFGNDLDFNEYYRKFVHREVSLPDISESNYKKIASKYVKYYLEWEGARTCFMELNWNRIANIEELIGGFKMTPRQIQEVFRVLGHLFDTTENYKGCLLWGVATGSILMSVLKLTNSKIYNSLGSKCLDPQEAYDFFKTKLDNSNAEWWFNLCLTGGGLKIEGNENLETILKRVGLITDEMNIINIQSYLGQWYDGWGHRSSIRFNDICQKIDQVEQWK